MDNEYPERTSAEPPVECDPVDDLDPLFDRAKRFPPAERDFAVMLRAVGGHGSRTRRIALRIAGTALAAAAVVAAAVLLIAPPGQPAAFALSAVPEAMRKVVVMKTTDPDGTMSWSGNRRYAQVRDQGKGAEFWDMDRCERATYDAARGSVILCTTDPWPHDDGGFDNGSALQGLIQQAENFGQDFEEKWERQDIEVDGRPMILISAKPGAYFNGFYSYGIDASTGRVAWAEGPRGRWTYEYPAPGPRDIYDLGVPREAPVLDWRATPEVLELRDKVVEAMQRPFGAYRAIILGSGGKSSHVQIVTADGRRHRFDRLPSPAPSDLTIDNLAVTAAKLLQHDLGDPSFIDCVCDGEWESHFWRGPNGVPSSRSVKSRDRSTQRLQMLGGMIWKRDAGVFFASGHDQRFESLGFDQNGWIGCRRFRQGGLFGPPHVDEEWFDPDHGFLFARSFRFSQPDAPWQLRQDWQKDFIWFTKSNPAIILNLPSTKAAGAESETLEWGELRPGVWYPKLTRVRRLIQADDGTWQEGTLDSKNLGWMQNGEVRTPPEPGDPRRFGPSVSYEYILAEPLDEVRDEWFEIPPEWLDVPLKRY